MSRLPVLDWVCSLAGSLWVWKGLLVGGNLDFFKSSQTVFSDVTKVMEWYFMNSNVRASLGFMKPPGIFCPAFVWSFCQTFMRFLKPQRAKKGCEVLAWKLSWITWITLPYNQKGCLESMLKPWLQLLYQDVVRPWCPGCKAVVGIGVDLCGSTITSQVLKR